MKKLSAIGLMIACGVLLGACEKDSDKDDDGVVWMEEVLDAVYVVNAGNAAASIPASITVVDVRNHRATQGLYKEQNGSDMVSTPSDMVTAWLSKRIFVVYPDKDMLEEIDGQTLKSLKKISTTGLFGDKGKGPRKMMWHWKKLLVLTDAGYVLSFSGDALEAEAAYEVGPGATAMYTMKENAIEVLHSGQGTEAPCISSVSFYGNPAPYTITSELLTNPVEYIRVFDDSYAAFILNAGSDGKAGSVIQRQWGKEPELRKIADATFACNGNDSKGTALYMVNTSAAGAKPTYSKYDILTNTVSTFIEDGEQYPTAIATDYAYHNTICVTSRPSADKSSTANGHVTIYSHGGQLQGKYEVGVNPSLIDFGYVMVTSK